MAPASRVTTQDRPQYTRCRARSPRALLQPRDQQLRRRPHRRHREPVRVRRPVRRARPASRSPASLAGPAFALAFLDYNLLGSGAINGDSRDAVGALGRGPRQEARPVPALRRRPVSGRRRRRRAVGDRRLHVDVALPVRAADRQHPTQRPDRAARATRTTCATASRRWSTPTPATSRSTSSTTPTRSCAPGSRRSTTCSRRSTRCPTSCVSTCAIPRTCSGSRPSSTPSTRSTPPSSSRATARGRSPRRRRSTVRTARPARPRHRRAPRTRPAGEFATESNAARFTPYYTMFRSGLTGEEEFVILRPFVPFSTNDRTNRAAGVPHGVERSRDLRHSS